MPEPTMEKYCVLCLRVGRRGFQVAENGDVTCKGRLACEHRVAVMEGWTKRERPDPNANVEPITARDPMKRLDAIIRRHGGVVRPKIDPKVMHLPMPHRGPVEDQMSFDDIA